MAEHSVHAHGTHNSSPVYLGSASERAPYSGALADDFYPRYCSSPMNA